MTDPANVVHAVKAVNEEMVLVNYEKADEFIDTLPNVNVVFGAITTAAARLRLYEFMEKLQDRVLYTGMFKSFTVKNLVNLVCSIQKFYFLAAKNCFSLILKNLSQNLKKFQIPIRSFT